MRRESFTLRGSMVTLLMLAALIFWSLPTILSDAEPAKAASSEFKWVEIEPDANLVFVTIPTDTIYGVDSTVVWTAFSGRQDLQWVHAFAPTVAGGDSAAISDVKCYLTNDIGLLADRSWWHFGSIATNVDADTSITFTPPMATGIRFAIYSSADQDTTYVGGFYIYR